MTPWIGERREYRGFQKTKWSNKDILCETYCKVQEGVRQWPNYFCVQLLDRVGVGRVSEFSEVGHAVTDLAE